MDYSYKNKEFYYSYILVIFVVAFISLGMAVRFPGNNNIGLLVGFSIAIFVLFALLSLYLFFVKKKYDYIPPLWTFVIPIVITIINIIVVSTTPDTVYVSFYDVKSNYIISPFHLTNEEKFFYIVQYFSVVIGIFIGVTYAPKILNARKHLTPVVYLAYVFIAICILCSLILEHDSYLQFFTSFKDYLSGRVLTTKSFFDHRNTFGAILLIGILGSIFLNIVAEKKWSIWPMLVCFIFMVFTLSKGSLILAILSLIGFLIYWLISTYKEHKKRNIIVISSVAIVLLVGIILFFSLKAYEYYALSDDSFIARTIIWKKLFYVTREMPNPLFGLGYGVSSKTILEFNDADVFCEPNWHVPNTHNIYLEYYAHSGIIGALAFVGAFAYIIYVTIKKWKNDKSLATFLLLTEFIVALYWMIEG